MSRIHWLTLLSAFYLRSVLAQEPAPQPSLIVTIVVDQYSADLFAEYRGSYNHGLARLSKGIVFPSGYQSHAATETCPGHATILTGARPSRTGIIANDWIDPNLERDKDGKKTHFVYCAEDPSGSSKYAEKISYKHLNVPTLGDRLMKESPSSRVVAVSGKDRSAVMLGGERASATIWWTRAGFTTYAKKENAIPPAITAVLNPEMVKAYASPTLPQLPEQCRRKSRVFQAGSRKVGTPLGTKGGSSLWRATPAMDYYTVQAAMEAAKHYELGKRGVVDLLAVGLSATDYIGHFFGAGGAEMCAQQAALDENIGWLLAGLDRAQINYLVVLTADHGAPDLTERLKSEGVEAHRLSGELDPKMMNEKLKKTLGVKQDVIVIEGYFTNDIYLTSQMPRSKKVLETISNAYRDQTNDVEMVFTRAQLEAVPEPTTTPDEWTLEQRAKASYDRKRSGDLVVLLKRNVSLYRDPSDKDPYAVSHGSPWEYDRRVPIIFWWEGVAGSERPDPVETVDIAPTLAKIIGITVPSNEIDGQALTLSAKP